MPKLSCCNYCKFYAHSPYMVCAVNPKGVIEDECPDFRLSTEPANEDDPLSWYNDAWETPGAIGWHPIFSGRHPNCEYPIWQTESARVYWDCLECGWKDDAV